MKNSAPTAAVSTKTASRGSLTPTTTGNRGCRTGRRSRCRCSRRRTGAAKACIRAATSRASSAPLQNKSGWRATASSIGRISIRTTASRCRRNSSAISLRAKRPAGTSNPRCCCKCAIRTNSSSGTRRNGRSNAPSGPGCSSTQRIFHCRPSAKRRNHPSPTKASATASRS